MINHGNIVSRWRAALVFGLATLTLAACDSGRSVMVDRQPGESAPVFGERTHSSVLGEGGLNLFGGKDKVPEGASIGVNTFLWRASLDTMAFMPLASADPFGGVIITDWYSPPESPGERMKVTVYILDRLLRADAVRVSVFRQQRNGADWAEAPVDPALPARLEDTVLTRARQLRQASLETK